MNTSTLQTMKEAKRWLLRNGKVPFYAVSKPISGNTMLYALGRLGFRGRMTVHGFRTTASTLLNENGHPADVIEAALAHTKGDIRSIYNRALYLTEREKMYQWWADYVDLLRLSKNQTAINPVT